MPVYTLYFRGGGIGGGESTKLANVCLNWRRLLIEGSESILAIAGANASPWLIPFAGLIVWNKIWSIFTIQITERHAVVIWTMWINVDTKKCIEKDIILDLVNTELLKYNRPRMNREELDMILRDLVKMDCIEYTESTKLWLRESVNVAYT